MIKIIDCIQGSDEWFDAKRGMMSASNFSKILNKGSGRGLYMRRLAGERLTGETQETYSNGNMEAGIELEAAAREYYEELNSCEVEQVGFVKMSDWIGCSPDGLVSDDGLIEIKSVLPSTHINNILRAKMPTEHIPQVQGQLFVTGRKWCDWISFCPAIKVRPFFCVRISRDGKYVNVLEIAISQFVTELQGMIKKINETRF